MKLSKHTIILSLILLTLVIPNLFAFPRLDHDDYMTQVLFGDKALIYKNFKEVEALKCASYLALDQFNGNGKEELSFLKQMKVKKIPKDISVIDFSSNSQHRSYTHRGWDFNYINDRANWKERKNILIATIDKIFTVSKKQADSFGALVYYIHVLGDHIADEKIKKSELKIDFAGRLDEYDIVHELMKSFAILFKEQRNSVAYLTLSQKMRAVDKQVKELNRNTNGMTIYTVDDFEIYKAGREELMNVLLTYVPELLRNVDFFRNKFPMVS